MPIPSILLLHGFAAQEATESVVTLVAQGFVVSLPERGFTMTLTSRTFDFLLPERTFTVVMNEWGRLANDMLPTAIATGAYSSAFGAGFDVYG